MTDLDGFAGYIEYTGSGVQNGLMDARKAAKALIGLDGSLRFFAGIQHDFLQQSDYEIPVRVQPGSWQALIPQNLHELIVPTLGLASAAYFTTAAKKMAERDFANLGMKDVFHQALQGMQWFIRIGKHLGDVGKRRFAGTRWRDSNNEIGIPNEDGLHLFVPIVFFEWFDLAPKALLSDLSNVVSSGCQLNVCVVQAHLIETVSVTEQERHIFVVKGEENEVLFPDLVHGQPIALEGFVTRGNEKANSIGFLHRDHILTCYPTNGNIVRFKHALFLQCRITGTVSRQDKRGRSDDLRPKIVFDDLVPLRNQPKNGMLFDHAIDTESEE